MKKLKRRTWVMRLRRLPQTAQEAITHQFHRIPQRVRFFVITLIFSIITAFFASQFPLSVLPEYRVGDIVVTDIVVPADLISSDEAQITENEHLKDNPVLVYTGGRVTAENLPLIDAVRRYQIEQRHPKRIIGLVILVMLLNFALFKSTVNSQSSRLGPRTAYWVASSALMIQIILIRVGMFSAAALSTQPETAFFGDMFEFELAIPFAACALVLSLLIGSQAGLVSGLMTSLLVGFISPHGLAMSAFALAGSVTAIYSAQRYRTRNAVTFASSLIALFSIPMSVVAVMIANHSWNWKEFIGAAVLCIIGALLTAAIASFMIPIYESLFDILTDMKLMELSNPDNPLLRQLAIQTPGTHHHSFMVGVLAEESAKSIGANALLVRTGCLYHDVGKLAAPNMYIENQQGGPNPHDKVSPLDSVRIITGHVRRGVQMAREADLPSQIIDFIPQHHGTRVLAYFYHKAKSQAESNGQAVNMDDFRYPGPKPQSREAVILMLSDGAEASVRSLEDPTPENISAIIKKIVDSVVADGQLDESNITMRELKTIRESLVNTLTNIYHKRISYPGFNPLSETQKKMMEAELNAENGPDDLFVEAGSALSSQAPGRRGQS